MEFHHLGINKYGEDWSIMFLIDESSKGTISIKFTDLEFYKSHDHNLLIRIITNVGYFDDGLGQTIKGREHIHEQRLNVLSSSAVTSLSRQLREDYLNYNPNKLPFNIIIQQAIAELEKAVKSESKIVSVNHIEMSGERPKSLLGPFFSDKAPNLLFGDGGGGKSYFCLRAALSLASGCDFLGHKPEKTCGVLFLDYEDVEEEFKARTEELCSGIQPAIDLEAREKLYYWKETIALHDIIPKLKKEIQEKGIEFLIVDSVGRACGGELEKAEVANTYWNDLKNLGITTLSIAHVAKGGVQDQEGERNQKGQKSAFGSVFFGNGAREAWNYVFQDDESEKVRSILYQRKSNRGKKSKPIPIEIDFCDSENTVTVTNGKMSDWEEAMSLKDKLLRYIKTGQRERKEIEKEFEDYAKDSVRKELQKLKRSKLIQQSLGDCGPYFVDKPTSITEKQVRNTITPPVFTPMLSDSF